MNSEPLTRNGNTYQFPTIAKWAIHIASLTTPEELTKWARYLVKESDGAYRLHPFDFGSTDYWEAWTVLKQRAAQIGAAYQKGSGGSKGYFYNVAQREAALKRVEQKHQRA